MMKIVWYSILVVMLWSCQNIETTPKPEKIISEDTMVEILADLAIYGAAKSQDRRLVESKNVDVVQYIKKKYNVDTTQIRENISYYVSDIDRYKKMQEAVRNILQQKKKEIDAKNKAATEEKQRKLKEKAATSQDVKELQSLSIN